MRDETILILAAGALALGFIVHRKLAADAALQGDDFADLTGPPGVMWSDNWSTPAPPVGATWPAPVSPTAPAPGPPAAFPPAAPAAPAMTADQANAAYEAALKAGRDLQQSDYDAQVAELRARVESGAVTVGSPYYNSTMAYLANMRGGVARAGEEMAALHAAGLAGARGPGRGPRLAWSRPRG